MRFWNDFKDLLLAFSNPKGKYYLVSFPKTGRTWLMYMLKEIEKEYIELDSSISNRFPKKITSSFLQSVSIEKTHDYSEIILENGNRPNPDTIFYYNYRRRFIRSKVIFLVRDPRDVVVSHFHQVTKRANNPFLFDSISDFVRDEKLGFNRIIYFYNLWIKNKQYPLDFLLVKYEDLMNDGPNELLKILNFLEAIEIKTNNKIIESVYNNSSAERMRELEKSNQLDGFSHFGNTINHLKVRKAMIGGYKNELSKEDILYCNNQMEKLDLYFDYNI